MSGARDDAARDPAGDGADDPAGDPADATRRHAPWWAVASVAAGFGLLYAYDLFEAVSNLLGVAQLNSLAAEAGVPPVVPWVLPVAAVALPPVVYLVALLAGRRRNLGVRALLLTAGLAVVAATTLSLTVLA